MPKKTKKEAKDLKESQKQQITSMVGQIVDMPLEDFKEAVVKQKINVGTINNLVLNLEAVYYQMRQNKDQLILMMAENKLLKEKPEFKKALDGLYAELTKAEQKIVYLKDLSKRMMNVG